MKETESQLKLLGDIRNNVILEVGCGSGHSLEFFAKNNARELWQQFEKTSRTNTY
ncbi:hypothetical protein J14TS2_44610 [Bacillus sp. J14TS2]|nr:hypothetical protein J14TS2_44610 [Bacillus sp. J14TS2]